MEKKVFYAKSMTKLETMTVVASTMLAHTVKPGNFVRFLTQINFFLKKLNT